MIGEYKNTEINFIDVNLPRIALIKRINANFSIDKPIIDNLCRWEISKKL